MLHPILSHRYSLWSLLPFWLVHTLVPAALWNYYAHLDWTASLVDGAVYGAVLMVVGVSLWFPVGYGRKDCPSSRILINNVMVGVVAVVTWLVVSGLICQALLGHNQNYIDLTWRILPIRILWGIEEYMMIMVMYHFFVFYRDLEEKRLQEEVLKKQVKESELKTLKAQLNPHFLFNSLNSVSALTLSQPEGARRMIAQLSELLRYSLRNKHTDLISVSDELQNIRRYMEIEKVRFGPLLNYEEEVSEACSQYRLPAMILQPLFENAIKHGLYESLEGITVTTTCCAQDGELRITVSNNYDDASASPRGGGLGLRHTANILRNLYNRDGLLKASGSEGVFRVELIIPQNQKNG
jgi:sensor histidine kinase YesM